MPHRDQTSNNDEGAGELPFHEGALGGETVVGVTDVDGQVRLDGADLGIDFLGGVAIFV